MLIRKAKAEELDKILTVFEKAKGIMRAHGNMKQWTGNYPSQELLLGDISRGDLYVIEDGGICAVFSLIIGEDPTYGYIEGAWKSSSPYATVHRVASTGEKSGIAKACFDYCKSRMNHLRVDTHADNYIMQSAVEKQGFVKCGTIYIADGSPRLAYEYIAKNEDA